MTSCGQRKCPHNPKVAGSNSPPATKETMLRGFVPRALAPGQRFRVRPEVEDRGFSGLFLGTYSPVPYAALRGEAARTRPAGSGFAVESSIEEALRGLHRACSVQLHYSINIFGRQAGVSLGRARCVVSYGLRRTRKSPSHLLRLACRGGARAVVPSALQKYRPIRDEAEMSGWSRSRWRAGCGLR